MPTVIDVGPKARDIAITPDGRRAYVSTDDGVAVLDPATDTVITTIPGPASAVLAVSPDSSRAYIAGTDTAGGAIVSVVDTATDGVVGQVPIRRTGRDISPTTIATSADGQRVLVGSADTDNQDNVRWALSVIDTTGGGAVVAEIALRGSSDHLAAGPNGATAYVLQTESNGLSESYEPYRVPSGVSVIDVAAGAVVANIPGGSFQDIASTPDGSRAYVTDINGTVVVIDRTSSAVAATVPFPYPNGAVPPPEPGPTAIAISADGRRVFVAHVASISVIDTATNTSDFVATLSRPAYIEKLAVRPDGRLYLIIDGSLVTIDHPNSL